MTVLHPTMRVFADGNEETTSLLTQNFIFGSVSVSLVENVSAFLFEQPLPPRFGLISYTAAIPVFEDDPTGERPASHKMADVNIHIAVMWQDRLKSTPYRAWVKEAVASELNRLCKGHTLALMRCNEFPLWLETRWDEIMAALEQHDPVVKKVTLAEWRQLHYPPKSLLGRLVERIFSGFGL